MKILWPFFLLPTLAWAATPWGGKIGWEFMLLFFSVLIILVTILSTPVVLYFRRTVALRKEQKREDSHLPSAIFLTVTSFLLTIAAAQKSHLDTGFQLVMVAIFPLIGFLVSLRSWPKLPSRSRWRWVRWSVVSLAFAIPVLILVSVHDLTESVDAPPFLDDGFDFIQRVIHRPFCRFPIAKQVALRWIPLEQTSSWRKESRWPTVLNGFRQLENDVSLEVRAYGCDENAVTLVVIYPNSPTAKDGRSHLIQALRAINDQELANAIAQSTTSGLPLDVQINGKVFHSEMAKQDHEPGYSKVWVAPK